MNIEQSIALGAGGMGIQLPQGGSARLAAYVALLERWNRAYNLTGVRRAEDMITRHVLDSLSIRAWLQGPRVLDVGSGAGLPGIPLAVATPELEFYLLDSNGKRTRFLTQAAAELRLANVHVVRSRVEDYRPEAGFDSVVSRAFAALLDLLGHAGRLCAPGGRVLAMKGTRPDAELACLPPGYALVGVHALRVPGLVAERHLVQLVPVRGPRGAAPLVHADSPIS